MIAAFCNLRAAARQFNDARYRADVVDRSVTEAEVLSRFAVSRLDPLLAFAKMAPHKERRLLSCIRVFIADYILVQFIRLRTSDKATLPSR